MKKNIVNKILASVLAGIMFMQAGYSGASFAFASETQSEVASYENEETESIDDKSEYVIEESPNDGSSEELSEFQVETESTSEETITEEDATDEATTDETATDETTEQTETNTEEATAESSEIASGEVTEVATETSVATETATASVSVVPAIGIMPAAAAQSNGVWGSSPANTVISNVTLNAGYSIAYTVNLSGNSKKLEIIVPRGANIIAYDTPSSNNIIDNVIPVSYDAVTRTRKLVINFKDSENGIKTVNMQIQAVASEVYSNQSMSVKGYLSLNGVTTTEYTNTLNVTNYRGADADAGVASGVSLNAVHVYPNVQTSLYFYSTIGNYPYNVGFTAMMKGLKYDLTKVMINNNPIGSDVSKITLISGATIDPNTHIISFADGNLSGGGNNILNRNVKLKFDFPSGTVIKFPLNGFKDFVIYEGNNEIDAAAKVAPSSITRGVDGAITLSTLNITTELDLLGLIGTLAVDSTLYQPLVSLRVRNLGSSIEKLKVKLEIPTGVEVTHLRFSYIGNVAPIKIYDSSDTLVKTYTSGNSLDLETSLTGSMYIQYESEIVMNQEVGTNFGGSAGFPYNGITLIGKVSSLGAKTFKILSSSATSNGIDGLGINDTASGNVGTIQTSNMKKAEMHVQNGFEWRKDNGISTNSFLPGENILLKSILVGQTNGGYVYAYRQRFLDQLVYYFSLPNTLTARDGSLNFTPSDVVISNEITESQLDVSVVMQADGITPFVGINGGPVVKVKINNFMWKYEDPRVGPNNNAQILFLKLRVKDDIYTLNSQTLSAATSAIGSTNTTEFDGLGGGWIGGDQTSIARATFGEPAGYLVGEKALAAPASYVGATHLQLNITPQPRAEMNTLVDNIGNKATWAFYDPSDPDSTVPMKTGTTGNFKMQFINTLTAAHTNSHSYFVIPKGINFKTNLTGTYEVPTGAGFVAGTVYYTTGTILPTSVNDWITGAHSDMTSGGVTWVAAGSTIPTNATAIKLVVPSLAQNQKYEAIFEFKVPPLLAPDYIGFDEISIGQTAFHLTLNTLQGKTAGMKLIKSTPPKLTSNPSIDAISTLEYWTSDNAPNPGNAELVAFRTNFKNVTITDDVNGKYGNPILALDLDESTVTFTPTVAPASLQMFALPVAAAVPVSFRNFNAATDLTSRREGTYTFKYVAQKDFDGQTNQDSTEAGILKTKTITIAKSSNPINVVTPNDTNIKLLPDKTQIQNEQNQIVNWDAIVKIPQASKLANYYKYQVDFKMPADSLLEFTNAKLYQGNTEITNFGSASKKDSIISFNFSNMEAMTNYADQELTVRYATKYNGTGKPQTSSLLGYASAYANNNQNVGFNPSEATVKVDKGFSNFDDVAPVITVTNSIIEWPVNAKITKENIINSSKTTVNDNKDNSDDLQRAIETSNIDDVNYKILGDYGVTLNVTDSSGNKAEQKTVTIRVLDEVKPTITVKSNVNYELNNSVSIDNFIKDNVTVTDNYDKKITPEINNYDNIDFSKVGTYKVKVEATDSSANVANAKEITVTIAKKVVQPASEAPESESPKAPATAQPPQSGKPGETPSAGNTTDPTTSPSAGGTTPSANPDETGKVVASDVPTSSSSPTKSGETDDNNTTTIDENGNITVTDKDGNIIGDKLVPSKTLPENGISKKPSDFGESGKNKNGDYSGIKTGETKDSFGYGQQDETFGDMTGVGIIVAPTFKYFKITANDLPKNITISKDGNYFVMVDKNGNELGYAILAKGGNPKNENDWLLYVDQYGFPLGVRGAKKNPSTNAQIGNETILAFGAMTISLLGIAIVLNKKKEENNQ